MSLPIMQMIFFILYYQVINFDHHYHYCFPGLLALMCARDIHLLIEFTEFTSNDARWLDIVVNIIVNIIVKEDNCNFDLFATLISFLIPSMTHY